MFSINAEKKNKQLGLCWFPSPLGDYVFNQSQTTLQNMIMKGSFRPLSGIMFSIQRAFFKSHWPSCFRPLSGIMFSIILWKFWKKKGRNCFRPLSGIMFSIIKKMGFKWASKKKFPSPLGDYVFNPRRRCCIQTVIQFPSPLGDYVFNLSVEMRVNTKRRSVSVPSRGLCFQSQLRRRRKERIFRVSVPSRGLCFQS